MISIEVRMAMGATETSALSRRLRRIRCGAEVMKKIRSELLPSFALLAALAWPALAAAEVVTLQATRDNTLFENATGALSNGAGEHLFAGATGDKGVRRAVLAFDVADFIPAGSTIDSVRLTLNMNRSQRAGAENFPLYRLLADWGEGTSVAAGQEGGGGPATTGDATWIHTFYASSFWATPGGDFARLRAPRSSSTARVSIPGARRLRW